MEPTKREPNWDIYQIMVDTDLNTMEAILVDRANGEIKKVTTPLSNGMTIQEFIEKAIKGGWDDTEYAFVCTPDGNSRLAWLVGNWEYDEKIFLDPKLWQAVGKVEGWSELKTPNRSPVGQYEAGSWFFHMHRLIDALAEGKTIEEYLATL